MRQGGIARLAAFALLGGCAQTNESIADGAVVDASAEVCSESRTATVVVVTNVDGYNAAASLRVEVVLDLLERLLSGDGGGDGVADGRPLESIRLFVVPNEMEDHRYGDCAASSHGEFVVSECGSGGDHQLIRGGDWRTEAACRLADVPGDGPLCLPATLETTLVALSTDETPIDLSPREPLGGTTNSGYRAVDDVLVVLMEAADYRDDCSRASLAENPCPAGDLHCCDAALEPLERAAAGLLAVARGRATVFASLGMHRAFDPQVDPAGRAEDIASHPDCFYMRPHTRMARLAGLLYPRMHLVELDCAYEGHANPVGLEGLVRHVRESVCE